jgi:hypothetical protein
MSSTKRGSKRSPADNYPTPAWAFHRFLDGFVRSRMEPSESSGLWLEPGAGEGNLIYAANDWFNGSDLGLNPETKYGPTWDACELREECEPHLKEKGADIIQIGDYFEKGPPAGRFYSFIVSNPPFRLAQEFILRSLDGECRYVSMLLRLNYLGSANRHPFMSRHAPDLYVLPNRPSFKATGETDSIDYAWFVWDKVNLNRSAGQTQLLDLTDLAVRKAEHQRLRDLELFGVMEAEVEDAAKIIAA